MTSVTEAHDEHATGYGEAHGAHPDSFYIRIALILAVLTGIEVALSYADVGPFFLPALFVLMAIKFAMVCLFFMHLKFDSAWFNLAFWLGLGLAIGVYFGALACFHFFTLA